MQSALIFETITSPPRSPFNLTRFLAEPGSGRTIVRLQAAQPFYCQGCSADSVLYLQTGRAKLTVASRSGKVATLAILTAGDFAGEDALAIPAALRLATVTAITDCNALRIERGEMLRVMRDEPAFYDFFLKFLLARNMRTQADLVDQILNSSERRLARVLLLMADDTQGERKSLIPPVTQESLAAMIGTTRSRVSFFMNRFRKLGFVEYNGRIRVDRPLLNAILRDEFPQETTPQTRFDRQAPPRSTGGSKGFAGALPGG